MSEMNTNPLVSVIVPVYNAAKYLRQTLDSICGQTLKDIEIILVDDGSTDESLSILKEYEQADSRITVLQQQNQYAGVARNNGMKLAKGRYLSFLDADDIFETRMLETLTGVAEKESADIVFCGADMFNDVTGVVCRCPHFCNEAALNEGADISHFTPLKDTTDQLFYLSSPGPWNKLFRRSFVKQHALEFADSKSSNDLEFVLLAFAHAKIASGIQDVLIHYRNSPTSISHDITRKTEVHVTAYFRLKQALISRGLWPECSRAFNYRFCASEAWHLSILNSRAALRHVLQWRKKWEPHFNLLSKHNNWLRTSKVSGKFFTLFDPVLFLYITSEKHIETLGDSDLFNTSLPVYFIVEEAAGNIPDSIMQSLARRDGRILRINLGEDEELKTCLLRRNDKIVCDLSQSEKCRRVLKSSCRKIKYRQALIKLRMFVAGSDSKKKELADMKYGNKQLLSLLNKCLDII